MNESPPTMSLVRLAEEACAAEGVSLGSLRESIGNGPGPYWPKVLGRVVWRLRNVLQKPSYPEIGIVLGCRSHSSVLAAFNRAASGRCGDMSAPLKRPPADKNHGQSRGVLRKETASETLEAVIEAYRLDWLEADDHEVGGALLAVPVAWRRTFEALEKAHRLGSPNEASDRLMPLPGDQGVADRR